MPKRPQQFWVGLASVFVLVVGGVVLFVRHTPTLGADECNDVVDRHAALYGERIGPEYAALLAGRRDAIVHACRQYATPEFVACARAANDTEALARCSEHRFREFPSRLAPMPNACADQADWRLALHEQLELPSIARGLAESRDDMIATCEAHWAAPYVECLAGAPSLAFAQACESVGRVRTAGR